MNNTDIQTISLLQLLIGFIPVAVVIILFWHWQLNYKKAIYSIIRMLIQLLLIGYVLMFVFNQNTSWLILLILSLMVIASSWIALNTSSMKNRYLFQISFVSILIGGGLSFIFIIFFILGLEPWYKPNYVIPLAGMIFANSMTSISIAIERLESELNNNISYSIARNSAYQASMIPVINSLFAVGLVSLPGMMTGQILSGVSPFIAARYQIMIMCMIFSSAGISTACFLFLYKNQTDK